jgi:hypothetical protein
MLLTFNKDGRCIAQYYSGAVPSQVNLLKELENRGIETGQTRILTIESFGMPVTVLFMILKSNLSAITEFQKELDKHVDKTTVKVSATELPLKIRPVASTNSINNWDRRQSKAIDNVIAASGSTAIGNANWYFPSTQEFTQPLDQMYQTNERNIEIKRDYIKVITSVSEVDRKFLISVFKDILNFFESSYALKERIEVEQKNFKRIVADVSFPTIPNDFNNVCMRRGSMIHDSSFDFSISEENHLKFGKTSIVKYMEKAIDQAQSWLDQVYAIMLTKLQEQP